MAGLSEDEETGVVAEEDGSEVSRICFDDATSAAADSSLHSRPWPWIRLRSKAMIPLPNM